MRYDTPLEDRRKRAERNRARYQADPEYRLREINRIRSIRGQPTIQDLSEMSGPFGRREA